MRLLIFRAIATVFLNTLRNALRKKFINISLKRIQDGEGLTSWTNLFLLTLWLWQRNPPIKKTVKRNSFTSFFYHELLFDLTAYMYCLHCWIFSNIMYVLQYVLIKNITLNICDTINCYIYKACRGCSFGKLYICNIQYFINKIIYVFFVCVCKS